VNPGPLPRAHSHNDYLRSRPLLDALESGFCSVEADVFPVDGVLQVAHDRKDLSPDRNLAALYLAPLWERYRRHGGIHANREPFHLLIDFKSDAEKSAELLARDLSAFAPMLTRYEAGRVQAGAVTVLVSGARPMEWARRRRRRLFALDGRPDDLGKGEPVDLFPLVSQSWLALFKWYGVGPMALADREKLAALVDLVHAEGRRLRFWAAPDNPAGWSIQWAAGVDHINTDKIPELATWIRRRPTAT
jgi:hypothetical protein